VHIRDAESNFLSNQTMVEYLVRQGDTLTEIASNKLGTAGRFPKSRTRLAP
jgi:hypothetical protein